MSFIPPPWWGYGVLRLDHFIHRHSNSTARTPTRITPAAFAAAFHPGISPVRTGRFGQNGGSAMRREMRSSASRGRRGREVRWFTREQHVWIVPPAVIVQLTGQYSKKCPQVEGHVLHLSARHAKLRREGYRKPEPDDGLDRFSQRRLRSKNVPANGSHGHRTISQPRDNTPAGE